MSASDDISRRGGPVWPLMRAFLADFARYAGRPRTVTTKRSAIDLVTRVDRATERLLAKCPQLRPALPLELPGKLKRGLVGVEEW